MSPTALSLALILLLAPAAAAQTAPPAAAVRPSLTIPRVSAPPSLTDYLDGVPRPDEAAITTFVQREPGDGVPASQQTEAYVSYDATHLYVIFVAREDAPGQVRASLTRREGFANDDAVGVILDTFNDRRRAYLFIVNPLGVQLDGVTTDGSNDDYSYDTVWDSEGQLTSFGFVARIAIPFKSLRFANVPEQEWGIGFARIIRRNNETSFWPYVTKRVSNVMQQLAVARGMREISAGRNIHFIPYAAFTRARFLDTERPAFATDTDTRAGVDGKIVVKDAFTVDLTLNPDFSQVESDEPQVTINRRFEVFFPEKRPFFIENASYFQTPITLFFSRRIADPQLGLRVTGKAGGWSVAGLAIDDRAPGRRVEPGDPARGDRTGIGVVRLQRDFGRQSSIGVLATTRDFGPLSSRVASVDGR
nr:carbohydrate binding family 9 domain-containing protein [Acidobacteriota bacterium]